MCRVRGVVIALRHCTASLKLAALLSTHHVCHGVQANTNPQIPMFSEGCCRIWLVLVILGIATYALLAVLVGGVFLSVLGAPAAPAYPAVPAAYVPPH